MEKLNNCKLWTSMFMVPLIVYNPISGNYPIGFGGWGVDIWAKLVIMLLSYVIIYHYLYLFFWNKIEEYIYKVFDWFFDTIGGYKLDPSFNVVYLENIVLLMEYLCYHYFLYFLFIM